METYAWSENDALQAEKNKQEKQKKREASLRPVSFIDWSQILGNKLEQPNHLEDPDVRPHTEVELHTWMGGGAFLSPSKRLRQKQTRKLQSTPQRPLEPVNENKTAAQSEIGTPILSPLNGAAGDMAELRLTSVNTPVRNRRTLARTTSSINPMLPEREYAMKEVEEHCWKNDCWIVIDDVVYDATQFGKRHPGGSEKIFENAGCDITKKFYGKGHSRKYLVRLKRMGKLIQSDAQQTPVKAPGPALKRTITW